MAEFFDKVSKKVTDVAKTAKEKATNTVKIAKLKIAISSDKNGIDSCYKTIGYLTYETEKDGKDNTAEIKETVEKIKKYEKHIAMIEKDIENLSKKQENGENTTDDEENKI